MEFWDDSLRICPKCKAKVRLTDETKIACPRCSASVWFFNYRKVKAPPQIPEQSESDVWTNLTAIVLLVTTGILALVALIGVFNNSLVAVVCSLSAIGFAAFGFLKHAEVRNAEQRLEHAAELEQFSQQMRLRTQEVIRRYHALLRTGDERIEEYFERIYLEAVHERESAEKLRAAAEKDRCAAWEVQNRIDAMAERFLDDHRKWVAKKLRADPDSYQRHKNTLSKSFQFVESVGYAIPSHIRDETLAKLKKDFQVKVREQALKDEQKRIKAQLREEKRLREEREQAIRESEQQEKELQLRLDEALRDQVSAHASEIEELQRQLEEAHSKSERAKSMAQLTKSGHVYILSNVGTLGENIFKVGMTRRLDPSLRVKELGDASVPFPFDVHAMFSCDDAPTLENALHRELTRFRVNRVNLRKEFFNVELDTILKLVRHHHGDVEYVAEPEALEYNESLTISPNDLVDLQTEFAEMGVDIEEDDEDLVGVE